MRDHRKLRAFQLADELVIEVYKATKLLPREEQFGLTSQMRRCSVSIPSNIVEGYAKESLGDYVRFLNIAYGSSRELEYQISICSRLGYLDSEKTLSLNRLVIETCKVLAGLIKSLRKN